jgi:4-aminobutyrate aminotransferase-like enzyme
MAVLDVLEQEQLLANARSVGDYTRAGLRELAGRHALIGDVRGSGLFVGVDLVLDRTAKTPATEVAARLVNGMRERGVLLSRIGPADNVLKIRPPMPFSRANADLLIGALDDTLAAL